MKVGATRKRKRPGDGDITAASDPERTKAITRNLLAWYDVHRRRLPWREQSSPYRTWVSEVMLQQTQVAAVVPYFERWMKLFPSVSALAKADTDAVLSAWQGLGYYSRARNLQRCAQRIRDIHGGRLPSDPEVLRKLPGIGRYTAGAIASIAFDRAEPAVDGNVIRVVTRLEALRGDPRNAPLASRLWEIAAQWVRCESPSRFNQALMELGALICTPESPRCGQCPVIEQCRARTLDLVRLLPEIPRRPKPVKRRVVVLVSRKRDEWLVVKQPPGALHWAGLYVLPNAELESNETPLDAARRLACTLAPKLALASEEPLATFSYPITRFRFEATAYAARTIGPKRLASLTGRYASDAELHALALPAPHRRFYERLRRIADDPTSAP